HPLPGCRSGPVDRVTTWRQCFQLVPTSGRGRVVARALKRPFGLLNSGARSVSVAPGRSNSKGGHLKRFRIAILIAALTALVVAAAASARHEGNAAKTATAQACVLLPDTKSSVRWELFDRPYLAKAFKAAGVSYSIVNAQNDAQKQRAQAEQCLTNGAKVILEVNLDSGSGAAIEALAAARGAKSIDYDRLTLNGKASYYVSFNNVSVGKLQGQGVVNGLKANGKYSQHPVVAELNGAPTDNN